MENTRLKLQWFAFFIIFVVFSIHLSAQIIKSDVSIPPSSYKSADAKVNGSGNLTSRVQDWKVWEAPDWFTKPPSESGIYYTYGFSDPGLDPETAMSQADERAKVMFSILCQSICSGISNLVYPADSFSAQEKRPELFSSSMKIRSKFIQSEDFEIMERVELNDGVILSMVRHPMVYGSVHLDFYDMAVARSIFMEESSRQRTDSVSNQLYQNIYLLDEKSEKTFGFEYQCDFWKPHAKNEMTWKIKTAHLIDSHTEVLLPDSEEGKNKDKEWLPIGRGVPSDSNYYYSVGFGSTPSRWSSPFYAYAAAVMHGLHNLAEQISTSFKSESSYLDKKDELFSYLNYKPEKYIVKCRMTRGVTKEILRDVRIFYQKVFVMRDQILTMVILMLPREKNSEIAEFKQRQAFAEEYEEWKKISLNDQAYEKEMVTEVSNYEKWKKSQIEEEKEAEEKEKEAIEKYMKWKKLHLGNHRIELEIEKYERLKKLQMEQ